MKKLALIVLPFLFAACHTPGLSVRKTDFGGSWQFTKDSLAGNWQKISLPHTPQEEKLVVIQQWQGDCWYKKTFEVPASAKDNNVFLRFEGVMHEVEIWVNGKAVARHEGGYTPFTVNVSQWVRFGLENSMALKVNNQDNPHIPPGKPLAELDFNYYGGIYRNVQLITTNKLYITDAVAANKTAGGGVFAHFYHTDKNNADGTLKTHIKNDYNSAKEFYIKAVFTAPDGKQQEFVSEKSMVAAGADAEIKQDINIKSPMLWGVTNPNMYTLDVSIVSGNETVDTYSTKTGIRSAEIKNDGFYLNGEKLYINGTNRHQEYPYLGYAISDEAQYRDAVKIKSAGYDFVRLSHYPQSEAFLNACDELGILVMDCISGWQYFGDATFQKNSIQEIRDLARRDRNHPSIIFWEVSLNESNMDEAYMAAANKALREELPFEDVVTAGWMDNDNYNLFIPARQHGKAPDYWTKYDKGNRKIFIAEYGDWEYYAQNAGFNQTAFSGLKEEERTSRQFRESGEKRQLQQAFNFMEAYNSNLKGKNTIGHANWLMFDYNRGYSPDLETSGISDIFRLPKFAYYFYQSQRDASQKLNKDVAQGPMAFIASNWNEKSSPKVTVYSNCDEVALYLNGKLTSKQKPAKDPFTDSLPHAPFVFNLGTFTPGTLKAVGYINGKEVTENTVTTAGKAARIVLEADLSGKLVNADKPDMIFVYAKIVDENGNVLPEATTPVTFSLGSGNAVITGEKTINAGAGIAATLLRTENLENTITVKATAAGLPIAILEIKR
ncbi:glycoside hydrolase family 2 TIM barrel-domain containing protein [Flavobacterium sp. RHBU_3]|uniref:glycoside hydrolase family 2 TIM barrel-domain containing protein n=1 Tax=Flavobacterium sp. RHBU_3 TaxID=3391184 RepID=UPI0039849E3A